MWPLLLPSALAMPASSPDWCDCYFIEPSKCVAPYSGVECNWDHATWTNEFSNLSPNEPGNQCGHDDLGPPTGERCRVDKNYLFGDCNGFCHVCDDGDDTTSTNCGVLLWAVLLDHPPPPPPAPPASPSPAPPPPSPPPVPNAPPTTCVFVDPKDFGTQFTTISCQGNDCVQRPAKYVHSAPLHRSKPPRKTRAESGSGSDSVSECVDTRM